MATNVCHYVLRRIVRHKGQKEWSEFFEGWSVTGKKPLVTCDQDAAFTFANKAAAWSMAHQLNLGRDRLFPMRVKEARSHQGV